MSFKRWSVRVSDPAGTICGAGVYLGRDLVLTCAHVVADALRIGPGEAPDGRVSVEFLGTAAPAPIAATVAEGGWWPVGERQEGDAAVLRLMAPAPAEAAPAPLTTDWRRGDTVWAYGYPRHRDLSAGVHASATVTGETMGTGWVQLNDRHSSGVEIQQGFSGGGVSDADGGKVFGIVVLALQAERMSWLLPVGPVAERLPLVREALTAAAIPRQRAAEAELDGLGTSYELPPDIRDFTGRAREIAELIEQIEENTVGPAVHSIAGMGGLGKTKLAVHLAHKLAPDYPDGQFLLDLEAHKAGAEHRPLTTGHALLALLQATLGKPQHISDTARLGRMWRDVLRRRRMIVVLDNAASYEQIAELLPEHPGSLVLVTSRRRLDELGVEGAVPMALEEFDEETSVRLFTAIVGERRVATDPEAVRDIVRLCGFLPLAIRVKASLAAGRQRRYPLARIRDEMAKETDRLRGLRAGHLSIHAAFSTSYAHLGPREQELFRRLGIHPPGSVSMEAAAALADDPEAAQDATDVLVTESLVDDEGGRLKMHDLLREFARERLAADEPGWARHREVAGRLLDFYLAAALAAQRTLVPARPVQDRADREHTGLPEVAERKAALAWFQVERENLLRCAGLAEEFGLVSYGWRILRAIGHFLSLASETDVAIKAYEAGLTAARGRDPRAEADLNALLGEAYRVAGQQDAALDALRAARDHYARAGDRTAAADMLTRIGYVRQNLGDRDEAVTSCERALAEFTDLGDEFGRAEAEYTLGMIWRLRGEYVRALPHLISAGSCFQAIGYTLGEARCLNLTGVILRLQNSSYDEAISLLSMAEELYEAAGDIRGLAHAINNRASVLGLTGRIDDAVAIHGRALDLLRRTRNFAYPDALLVAADLRGRQGDHAAAEQHLREALAYYQPAQARLGQARAHLLLSAALLGQGRADQALAQARESLALYTQLASENGTKQARAAETDCLAALSAAG
ncbi:tetratricopeptide repeat protein [Streptomyces sp. ISL-22]|uniref:tetratricopeptide repeat protein n=1 Tax=unclassified Streptomyces TaxID=2593676 RepID=UPI001BEC8919|nr:MULTISPECIES: tetratricopeptide repeat protein [unclassified Streptomyces]MBT2417457.1 tetratricopeptide repeat protein [Streptomyces sp. ISL-24]MBT2438219.1 tetratricopeptide repeat protein [Streptomyces sp. ISL-22]